MTLMSPETVSPRRRMLDDMAVRNFSPDTQREYVRAVKKLAAFLRRPPDTATAEEVRAFQIHLKESDRRVGSCHAIQFESGFIARAYRRTKANSTL